MSAPATTVRQIAIDGALDEANAGRPPDLQNRDPRKLVRVVCAWCGRFMRYEVWAEVPSIATEGGGPLIDHGMCSECAQKMEAI